MGKDENKTIRDLRSENNLLGLQKTEFEQLYKHWLNKCTQLKAENEALQKQVEEKNEIIKELTGENNLKKL